MLRNALIVGATGLTGQELVGLLIKSDYYNSVHVIGRRPYELEHPKVKSYTIDFDKLQEMKPEGIIHDVYICLGTTMKKAGSKDNFRKVDYTYVLEVGKWAKNNQVEKLAVISSIGATASTTNFYLKTKGEMEDDLAALNLPGLVILRPSLLLGNRPEFRLAERISAIAMRPLSGLMIGGLKKYKPVEASTVAMAMFKTLLNAGDGVTVVANEAILSYE